jgi:ABC-type branched-subunit amino acid transport system substrate-binding protein
MNIKEVNGKVQIRAYDGYDKEKRSPKIKYVGQASLYDDAQVAALMEKLDDKQKSEFTVYLENRKTKLDATTRWASLRTVAQRATEAAQALANGEVVTDTDAAAIYAAMRVLARALKRSGHPASKISAKAQQSTETVAK